MKDIQGSFRHRAALIRADIKYYGGRRRWVGMARSVGLRLRGHISETCQECGRGYRDMGWWAPQPLWDELMPRYAGLLCPQCFQRKATAAGIRVSWTPMVVARDRQATTNHWLDETRDWLMMGQPDPGYHAGDLVNYPQPTWAAVRSGLKAAGYPVPPLSYYPPENCTGFVSSTKASVQVNHQASERSLTSQISCEPDTTGAQGGGR